MDARGGTATPVAVTGLGVSSAFGRGSAPLADAVTAGRLGFAPVSRFDVGRRSARHAAQAPGSPRLADELVSVIEDACRQAGLGARDAAHVPLSLALHGDPHTTAVAEEVTVGARRRCGLPRVERIYTCACVAASTALANAASRIAAGAIERAVIAAGYFVEPDMFAVFDAGRALTRQAQPRPFSRDRDGMLLGDAAVAVVLEAEPAARGRGADVLAMLAGWGRAGDGYHVCRPAPDGSGLARAIESALGRAGVRPEQVGYVNANAPGSSFGDRAEAEALRAVFGPGGDVGDAGGASEAEGCDGGGRGVSGPAVSSTKSVHGHALEASALLEFAVTVLTVRGGTLPVNAGYLSVDEECRLDLVLHPGRRTEPRYALTLNCAFGGANTALLVGAA